MEAKIFNGKEIKIRTLNKNDIRNAKKFQDFINSFVKENAQILLNKRVPLKEEKEWLRGQLKQIKKRKTVFLVAEKNNTVIGTADVNLRRAREAHVGEFGIVIKNGYRGIGLGSCLMGKIIKLAKKELRPRPKIIRLSVFLGNEPAVALYKKFNFKEVASIPKQIQYKGKLINEIIMLLEL